MTIAEQIAELASYETGAAVVGAIAAGVWPIKLLLWGVSKMLDVFG